ncbi:hypothetical protein WS70_21510 [Burkholderia mayonis]|uniref:Uncharacterized protein n=1 Tax=Burkholderia mayonis TaxID=1385591 RepID=A0A1B4FL90_9BURK|nr:hypothetical protein WS70_21510 [Burkholderia mayonis]KVE41183.1 hypothetical protein WS70_15460 [Burkholderia mayonis]
MRAAPSVRFCAILACALRDGPANARSDRGKRAESEWNRTETAPRAIDIVRDALGRRLASRRASTDARPAAHAMRVFGGRPCRVLRPQPRSATNA